MNKLSSVFFGLLLSGMSSYAAASVVAFTATGTFGIADGTLSAVNGEAFSAAFVIDTEFANAISIDPNPNLDYQFAAVFSGAPYGGVAGSTSVPAFSDPTVMFKMKNNFVFDSVVFNSLEYSFSSGGVVLGQLNLLFDTTTNDFIGNLFMLQNFDGGNLVGSATGLATVEMVNVPQVPVPSAIWLFTSALGLIGMGRRFKP